MALTLAKTKRLFEGYQNYSNTVAEEVAAKIFNSGSATDVENRIPFAGSTTKYVTGGIRFKTGGALDFYSAGNVLQAGMTWASNVLFFLGQAPAQGLNMAGWEDINLDASGSLTFQASGGKLGFFGATTVTRRSVNNTTLTNPAGGATVDTEARTAINNLNTVVNSMRTGIVSYGLLELNP